MTSFRSVISVADERLAARSARGHVSVIDDDPGILGALQALFEYEGYACAIFGSVRQFLDVQGQPRFPGPRCILSDMSMPEMDGLALQSQLPGNSDQVLVFMSGVSTVPQVVQALRGGAVHYLTKPLDEALLLAAVEEALGKSLELQAKMSASVLRTQLVSRLTPREKTVALLIVQGHSIKTMADRLAISERAIKQYKQSILYKLEINTAFDLVRLQQQGLLSED